jgi:DNA-binding transcriptional LysR family regulator
MFNRHAKLNIPTELLRALVTLKDCGSYTRAAEILDLSQPAISAQIARLKIILGGELFEKGLGLNLTRRGTLALSYARRILAMHDQLITIAGPNPGPRQILIGMPRWFNYRQIIDVIKICTAGLIEDKVGFRCDESEGLVRDLSAGTLDIAFICNVVEPPAPVIAMWDEPFYWAKAPDLVLTPGAAIPLVSCPGSLPDRMATRLLDEANLSYVIAFSGPEHASRKAAVAAGVGIMLMPRRVITQHMEIVSDDYLPKPPTLRTGLFMREGLDLNPIQPLVRALEQVLKPRETLDPSLPPEPLPPESAPQSRRGARRQSAGSP